MFGSEGGWIGKPAKVTYKDADELRVLRGTVTNIFGFVEIELADGNKFMVSLSKVERMLQIPEDRIGWRGKPVTVIE